MTRTEALKLALQHASHIPKDCNSLFDFADMIEAYPKLANKILKKIEEDGEGES